VLKREIIYSRFFLEWIQLILMKSAIIIGSGVAGLAVAVRLKAQGFDVTVFEGGEQIGGKLGILENKGYRWDTGPSLFTMPTLVDELFTLFNENPTDYFTYQQQEVICNYFWEDGTRFSAPKSMEGFAEKAASTFNESQKTIADYLHRSSLKYELTAPLFLDQSLHKLSTYASFKAVKAVAKMNQLDLSSTLNKVNETHFKSKKLIQLFNRYATYNGSSPYETPGIMSMIPTLEMQFGTYFPHGGMRSIVESIYQLGLRHRVNYRLNEKVTAINYDGNKATGITTKTGNYTADVVVSNMDVFYSYDQLLPNLKRPNKILSQEKSSSAIIFYWGIKKQFPKLDLHNIFFGNDYEQEFDALFDKKKLANNSTVYVHVSSKAQVIDAPEGSENWFVMVNAPTNVGQNWNAIVAAARQQVIRKLSSCLGDNIADYIEVEEVLDPIKIDDRTASHQGSLYGTSSNSKFAAFLRHPNFSKQLKNLYFCGGSVHPGGGIPLCLKSAHIVSNLIAE